MSHLTENANRYPIVRKHDRLLDVWDLESFDNELLAELRKHERAICNYFTTDRQMMLDRQSSVRLQPFASNPYAAAFHAFTEGVIMPLMEVRVMRAWHYTRLLDNEVDQLRMFGIRLLSLATTQARIEALVAAGALTKSIGDALLADSPLHDDDGPVRSNKFWMVSEPMPVEHHGVEPLLESWGGESVYFRQRDASLQTLLKRLGRPRVMEVAVPVTATNQAYPAAKDVVAAFGRSRGCQPDYGGFDLWVERPLEPAAILAIHTEGEPGFAALGRGYPCSLKALAATMWPTAS